MFWDVRGLRKEALGWLDRCRAALEGDQGNPPELESEAGSLWLFVVGCELTYAVDALQLDKAYATYDAIRQRLESPEDRDGRTVSASPTTSSGYWRGNGAISMRRTGCIRQALEMRRGDQAGLASSYHQLGVNARRRGDLDARRRADHFDEAERRFRQALKMREGDLLGTAMSYHELGIVAQARDNLPRAERYHRKALQIYKSLRNPRGMAFSYHQLGIVAQRRGDRERAEGLYRQSLQLKEAFGDRPDLAATYGQLGSLAEEREDFEAALDWTVRCVALLPNFHTWQASGILPD